MTMALRATGQSIPWIGVEVGIFRKYGLLVEFPAFEVGGPDSAAGLIRGGWEFSQTDTVSVAERSGAKWLYRRLCARSPR